MGYIIEIAVSRCFSIFMATLSSSFYWKREQDTESIKKYVIKTNKNTVLKKHVFIMHTSTL